MKRRKDEEIKKRNTDAEDDGEQYDGLVPYVLNTGVCPLATSDMLHPYISSQRCRNHLTAKLPMRECRRMMFQVVVAGNESQFQCRAHFWTMALTARLLANLPGRLGPLFLLRINPVRLPAL